MANFKKILNIKGVLVAGEFSFNGELIAYDGKFPIEVATDISNISSINMQTNNYLIKSLKEYSQINVNNLSKVILDMEIHCIFIYKDIFLIIEKSKANLEKLFNLDINQYKDL